MKAILIVIAFCLFGCAATIKGDYEAAMAQCEKTHSHETCFFQLNR